MPPRLLNTTVLSDALYNMHPQSGATSDYARGVLLGVVSGLLAIDKTFDEAIALCSRLAPRTILRDSVPTSWIDKFNIELPSTEKHWKRTEGRFG